MFRLIRWLFLMAIIAALAGFSLTYRLRGQTPAQRVCELSRSAPCVQLALRWGETARQWEARLHGLLDPPAESAAPRPSPHPVHPVVTVAVPPHEVPPLDRHTSNERQAPDKILAQRGSR
jgi:hypothetical protein